jgi:hypothetical protein
VSHLDENMAAIELELDDADLAASIVSNSATAAQSEFPGSRVTMSSAPRKTRRIRL